MRTNNFFIDCVALKNCVSQYTYWNDESFSPLGVCWVTFTPGQYEGKIALLANIMTATHYRRKGIATALLNKVLEEVKVIITPIGSEEGGRELLENFGFIHDKNINMWVFIKKG